MTNEYRQLRNFQSQNLVILEGDVVVSQGDNVAQGCKLTAYMDTNRATMDSCGQSIRIQINPSRKN